MIATVQDLLARLKSLEYDLYLEGERVRFKYTGDGEPPEGGMPLLDALRERKGEAVAYLKGAKVKPLGDSFPSCFSIDGTLETTFREAVEDGWTDTQLLEYIDALREAGCLKGLWGFKVMDSSLIGSYWILSDTTARERIPAGAMNFTVEELRLIAEACRVFKGAKVIEIIRHKEKEAVNV